ncbi:Bacterial extracellular solute-binding protein, family 3 [Shimia sp. SK013]|uniref:substrate-binding periplasmic protein n=1 Tax=Shimia sp. SK013 TaxID=1389006 RepID=UPI0006B63819|nr:transporter substrate-binding domain-containing protein [Shimia sp. SK013]KPA22586.1 Bacterial extracellular solute-binding protein, family 3 [Shimia sp. SK013]
MFKQFVASTIIGFAFATGGASIASAEPIKTYAAVLPPFSIGEPDLPGISHELLLEISARTDLEFDIEYLPFKRMTKQIQETPDSLVMTALRSPAREDLFNWIVEVIVTNEVFATTSKPVNSIEEARSVGTVTSLMGSPRTKRLKEAGISEINEAVDTLTSARMLQGGRVDAWYTFDHRARFVTKSAGFDPSSIVLGAPIKKAPMWLASNLTFDPEIAAQLKAAIEELQADGTYDAIVAKYIQ